MEWPSALSASSALRWRGAAACVAAAGGAGCGGVPAWAAATMMPDRLRRAARNAGLGGAPPRVVWTSPARQRVAFRRSRLRIRSPRPGPPSCCPAFRRGSTAPRRAPAASRSTRPARRRVPRRPAAPQPLVARLPVALRLPAAPPHAARQPVVRQLSTRPHAAPPPHAARPPAVRLRRAARRRRAPPPHGARLPAARPPTGDAPRESARPPKACDAHRRIAL